MFSSSSCVCAVNHPATCLRPQSASTEKHRFIVGTCAIQDINEISILEYNEPSNSLDVVSIYSHPSEVICMDSSPTDPSLIVVSGVANEKGVEQSLNLWRMPKQSLDCINDGLDHRDNAFIGDKMNLEEMQRLKVRETNQLVCDIKWSKSNQLLATDGETVMIWNMTASEFQTTGTVRLGYSSVVSKPSGRLRSMLRSCGSSTIAVDPHDSRGQAAVSAGSDLYIVNTHDNAVISTMHEVHAGSIRDVDYNPNRPHLLITSGDDARIRCWDLRYPACPIKTLQGHQHWVRCAKYNPFHDQLLISGGSDQLVNLWRLSSASSVPVYHSSVFPSNDEDLSGTGATADTGSFSLSAGMFTDATSGTAAEHEENDSDMLVKSYEQQHEDTVHAVAWSPAEAWMFCSLSYDGRVILNHVPTTEKYKILL